MIKWLLHFIAEQQRILNFILCFHNLKQATFVTRSTYELILFEVASVNEIEMKRLKELLDVGVGQRITDKLFF